MSYILDALRRADAERERGAVPGIHTRQFDAENEHPPRNRSNVAVWIVAGVTVALLAALAWTFVGHQPAPPMAASPAPMPVTPMATAPVPNPPPAVAPTAPPALAAAPATAPQAVAGSEAPSPGSVEPVAPARHAATETAAARRERRRLAREEARQEAREEAREKAREGAREEARAATRAKPHAPIREAAAPTDSAPPTRAAAPADEVTSSRGGPLAPGDQRISSTRAVTGRDTGPDERIYAQRELPAAVRNELPQLAIVGSTYSTNKASRMLMISGQIFHEGDTVAPGVVLEQIRPHAAVLAYKGYRYEVAL